MSAPEFAVGDIVKLAGSSTKMVVHAIDAEAEEAAIEGEIICRWMHDGVLSEHRFKSAELIYLGSAN